MPPLGVNQFKQSVQFTDMLDRFGQLGSRMEVIPTVFDRARFVAETGGIPIPPVKSCFPPDRFLSRSVPCS